MFFLWRSVPDIYKSKNGEAFAWPSVPVRNLRGTSHTLCLCDPLDTLLLVVHVKSAVFCTGSRFTVHIARVNKVMMMMTKVDFLNATTYTVSGLHQTRA